MTRKRKYDIGNNTIIEDDGRSLIAVYKQDDKCTSSIGVGRPHVGARPTSFAVTYSRDGKLFYVNDFADPLQGFWLGLERLASPPEKHGYAAFLQNTEFAYWRSALHFSGYAIKADGSRRGETLEATHDAVLDYLKLAQPIFDEHERRFNEAIAHTGRDLRWIIKKIGAWVPFPDDPDAIVLSD